MSADDLHDRWVRCLLEACVLSVLRPTPAYGYDIAGRFERAGFARPKGGTLYPILARLESDGLVAPTWAEGEHGPSRKYYRLTPAGESAAAAIGEAWRSFVGRVDSLIDDRDRSVR